MFWFIKIMLEFQYILEDQFQFQMQQLNTYIKKKINIQNFFSFLKFSARQRLFGQDRWYRYKSTATLLYKLFRNTHRDNCINKVEKVGSGRSQIALKGKIVFLNHSFLTKRKVRRMLIELLSLIVNICKETLKRRTIRRIFKIE